VTQQALVHEALARPVTVSNSNPGTIFQSDKFNSDHSNDENAILLWFLCIYNKLGPISFFESDGQSQPKRQEIIDRLERALRFLVSRSLASRNGALNRQRWPKLFFEAITLFLSTKEILLKKVAAQARAEYHKNRAEVYLEHVTFSELTKAQFSYEAHQTALTLFQIESKNLHAFQASFGDLSDYIAEAIHHHYKDLLIKVWWRRHASLIFIAIGTFLALIVPYFAWLNQSSEGMGKLVKGWLTFLAEHFNF
jgi:hypothetical protein